AAGRTDVLRGEIGARVQLATLAEVARALRAVGRNLVRPREVGEDGLTVPRAAPQEGVVDRALGADVGHRAGLVDVEVRGGVVDGVAECPAALGRRIRTDGRGSLLGVRGSGPQARSHDGGADPDGSEKRAAADGGAAGAAAG